MEDFCGDLVAGVLEVHDAVGDLEANGNNDSLDVERPEQPVSQDLEVVWKAEISTLIFYSSSTKACLDAGLPDHFS
jgi:hypothetical protein